MGSPVSGCETGPIVSCGDSPSQAAAIGLTKAAQKLARFNLGDEPQVKGHLGVAQNSRARVTQVLDFGSIYQGGHFGTSFLSHSHFDSGQVPA